jgi:hypothetical protein
MFTPRKKISRELFEVTTSNRSPTARMPWTGGVAAAAGNGRDAVSAAASARRVIPVAGNPMG